MLSIDTLISLSVDGVDSNTYNILILLFNLVLTFMKS